MSCSKEPPEPWDESVSDESMLGRLSEIGTKSGKNREGRIVCKHEMRPDPALVGTKNA